MHNEHSKVSRVIEKLNAGQTIAMISDAGTPGISDPGFLLVREALQHEIHVECLPGATALIPAIVQSGLPSDRFFFQGFLPPKKGRQKKLEELAQLAVTVVIYESPHKLLKTLGQIEPFFGGDRKVSISRELTKKFEGDIEGKINSELKNGQSRALDLQKNMQSIEGDDSLAEIQKTSSIVEPVFIQGLKLVINEVASGKLKIQ